LVTRALNSMITYSLFGSASAEFVMPVWKNTAPVAGSFVIAPGGSRNVGVTVAKFESLPVWFSPPVPVGSSDDEIPWSDTRAIVTESGRSWRPGARFVQTLYPVGS